MVRMERVGGNRDEETNIAENVMEISDTNENTDNSVLDKENESELETEDEIRDPYFDINNYLYTGEKLTDVSDFEEHDSDDVESESDIVSNENSAKKESSKVKAKTPQEKITKKMIKCKYCDEDIISKNFLRHLKTWHSQETDVINILSFPKKSKQRKEALAVFRNETNFDLYIRGEICPNR
ncbi:hypothetical protein NQ318_023553 [Aromia moschata]|uniref:BED-type domain-containing protein n=1 Tax=Aromia moschata TaxID=1265417 RepID=A0AAV8YNX1_9CUCU|nr:hypothetical protein NQ318_023553 [Aromia moschata]